MVIVDDTLLTAVPLTFPVTLTVKVSFPSVVLSATIGTPKDPELLLIVTLPVVELKSAASDEPCDTTQVSDVESGIFSVLTLNVAVAPSLTVEPPPLNITVLIVGTAEAAWVSDSPEKVATKCGKAILSILTYCEQCNHLQYMYHRRLHLLNKPF